MMPVFCTSQQFFCQQLQCFLFFFLYYFLCLCSGLFCCVLVPGTLVLHLLYLDEFGLFGLLYFTAVSEAIFYAVGFVSRKRPFSTEAHTGLSYSVEKGLFRLNFFRLRIPTGGSSRKTRLFRLDPSVEKLCRKSFTRVFLTDRIAHPTTKHTPTRPHGHTPIPGTTLQYHTRR